MASEGLDTMIDAVESKQNENISLDKSKEISIQQLAVKEYLVLSPIAEIESKSFQALSNSGVKVQNQESSDITLSVPDSDICDACTNCNDVCGSVTCILCLDKKLKNKTKIVKAKEGRYTMCQVRRHKSFDSCWLVAKGSVYDVTEFLSRHVAGTTSILNHSGGFDCSEDMCFHSSRARGIWEELKIGKLIQCKSSEEASSCCII